jgi:elongation factor G
MQAVSSIQRFRNIGIMAHIDAGKTTCSERILFYTGKSHRVGEVHHGDTSLDWMPEEQKRGITITAAATTTFWTASAGPFAGVEHRINLIDTPGHVDFTIEVERSLRVLDGAVAVFDASQGVEPQSETVWHQADRYGVPRLAFINKVDKLGADFELCVRSIRERLGAVAIPVQLPLGQEGRHEGVIDLIGMRTLRFSGRIGEPAVVEPIAPEHEAAARAARASLVEQVAEVDDAFCAIFLEGEVTDEALQQALRRATLALALVPVLCGSAYKNRGIEPLLDAVVSYLPSPVDRPPARGQGPGGEEAREASREAPLCALAFKLTHDRNVGHLTWLRIYSGTMTPGAQLFNANQRQSERIGRIMQMHANQREDVREASAGDIVAVAGLRHARTGHSFTDPRHPLVLEAMSVPEPVMALAVEPRSDADQDRLAAALRKMSLEDPSLRVGTDLESGQTLVEGMGELHLEIVVSRLASEHRVEVRTGAPAVAYRETVAGTATVDRKFIRQNGGAGDFARVVVEVSPRARGEGFRFVDDTRGGTVPREFIPAVEKGIVGAMSRGLLAGYPIVDLQARLLDGAAHAKDSNALAFETAGSLALQEAAQAAGLALLEPLMSVEILSDDESLGNVIGDLNSRRGEIRAIGRRGRWHTVDAVVPLAALFGYVETLRNLSRGRASATLTPSHYAPVPGALRDAVIQGRKR